MLNPVSQPHQNPPPPNPKLILNSLQLLTYQLQTKDITIKKQSIQTVQVIALTMSQQQITTSLLPFLTKTLVEQNNKQLKLSIVKSFKNICDLLSTQYSYVRMIQVLIDIIVAFDEQELRIQAILTLDMILFEENVLEFDKFSKTFKHLVMNELFTTNNTQGSIISRNAQQLSFRLIKYLFKNGQVLGQSQLRQVIQFIKNHFLLSCDNNDGADFANLKILAENFHLLVQFWSHKFLSQLNFFVDYFVPSDNQDLKDEIKQKLLQQNNIEPEIPKEKSSQTKQQQKKIPKQIQSDLKSKIVPALILYGKNFSLSKAYSKIQQLLKENDTKITISLIKKTRQILQTFKDQNLNQFLIIFKNFPQQNHDIKKTILQIIDQIQFQSQAQKNQEIIQIFKSIALWLHENIIKNNKNSPQLKNIFIQSLIKSKQSQSVSQALNESDYDFKVKIFIKLPDSMLHKNLKYTQIIDSLLSQPKKNFRSKLNIILNLIVRIQDNVSRIKCQDKIENNLEETFDISYLPNCLVNYFSDRIAIIRVNAAKLYALLMYYYDIQFQSVREKLEESFYGENKGWFERQNVLIMIKEYAEICSREKDTNKTLVDANSTNNEFYNFIVKALKSAQTGCYKKFNMRQSQKIIIKNISNLAEQIINQYSIEV